MPSVVKNILYTDHLYFYRITLATRKKIAMQTGGSIFPTDFQFFAFLDKASISSLKLAMKSAFPLVGFQPRALDLFDRARQFVLKYVVSPYHEESNEFVHSADVSLVTHQIFVDFLLAETGWLGI